jgi:hypothetical protein
MLDSCSLEGQSQETNIDFSELGSIEGDGLYSANRSFYLLIRKGPEVSVPIGSILRLTQPTAAELFFANKIFPLDIVDGLVYAAILPFRHVDSDGLYIEIEPGTRVKLTQEEGIKYLKQNLVKPCFTLALMRKRR